MGGGGVTGNATQERAGERVYVNSSNATTYTYSGSLLTLISDASGQQVFLDYAGGNLISIRVASNGATQIIASRAIVIRGGGVIAALAPGRVDGKHAVQIKVERRKG